MSDSETMKLAKFLAHAGVASRRASEKLIAQGKVMINGEVVTEVGRRVDPNVDEICYEGKLLSTQAHVYYLLHKPKGYTCSSADAHAEKLAIDLLELKSNEHIYSVGRLDKDSEGLILFTNDGELCNQLTHPKYQVPKTYLVDLIGNVKEETLQVLLSGVTDEGDLLQAKSVKLITQDGRFARVEIVVCEGKKREVRRMCKHFGYHVKRLTRTSFGPLSLGRFKAGYKRKLTASEIARLKNCI